MTTPLRFGAVALSVLCFSLSACKKEPATPVVEAPKCELGSYKLASKESLPAKCDLTNRAGLVVASPAPPDTQPSAGSACTADFQCWIGDTCVGVACAANSVDNKLHGSVTVPEAGNYVLTLYAPADKPADAPPGVATTILYTFASARREVPKLKRIGLDPDFEFNALHLAALQLRVRFEPELRAIEQRLLAAELPDVEPVQGPIRQACEAPKYSYKGQCYEAGQTFELVYKLGGTYDASGAETAAPPKVTVAVKKVTGSTAILVDTRDAVDQAAIDKIANAFDTIAGPRVRGFFNGGKGHEGGLDTDGNKLLGIVLSSVVAKTGAGIFDARDVIPAASLASAPAIDKPSGNESDILWAVPPGAKLGPNAATFELVMGTLAHEYQHVISFARKKNATTFTSAETLFLNEGLSHLAEDLSGYGASNIDTVGQYLIAPESAGLLHNTAGADRDTLPMRGVVYLYLRYLFEKWGGAIFDVDHKLQDGGAAPKLEQFFTGSTNGLASLAAIAGSSHKHFQTFFPALAVSGNADAPALATDCRFQYQEPSIDPWTCQQLGLKLKDDQRPNAYGVKGKALVGYNPQKCVDKDAGASEGTCEVYSTGGVSFIWEDAVAGDKVEITGPSAYLYRVVAVKVK